MTSSGAPGPTFSTIQEFRKEPWSWALLSRGEQRPLRDPGIQQGALVLGPPFEGRAEAD